jgi:metal-dependent amidase/aminoacylase/carboxypeptidase family protein
VSHVNLVAGMGGALATAKALQEHNVPGKVILLGTPAEEGDGGKIVMLKHGGYKAMDVSLAG